MSRNISWRKKLYWFYLKHKGFYLWVFIFICVACAFGIYHFLLMPKIELKGQIKILINYQSDYKEKGYKATFLGNDVTDSVSVDGEVNTQKLGDYEIVYSVKVGAFSTKKKRIVSVRDIKDPEIEVSRDDIILCPGDEVVPEKVEAHDNYDGDLSEKVKNTIGKDRTTITYSVQDSSGNISSITKKIVYEDREAPQITLNGNATVYLYVGDNYSESGVTVVDNCEDGLEKNVSVEGVVDTSKVGEYVLTYQVSDSSSNASSISRTVKVRERGSSGIGVIYLTFDDGPNSGTTNVILDILKEEGVKATFFVTSRGPDELIKREYEEGHTVGLHTATHDYSIVYASYEAYFQDLNTVSDRVKRITGYESKIIRFPGGSSNTVSRKYTPGIMSYLTDEVQRRGYRYYDWNISSGDAGSTTDPNVVYSNVVNHLRHDRMNMVLMHDIKPYTRDALRNIIHYGKENGYSFEAITMDTEMVTQRVNN